MAGNSLSFVINTWEDWPYAIDLLSQIRQHYPDAEILVIGDGVKPKRLIEACGLLNAKFHPGKRLKDKHSNAWSLRMFRLARDMKSDYVVKIDPDCQLNRPITLPDESFDIAARLYGRTKLNLIGPCIVFNRKAMQAIWKSQRLKGKGSTYRGRSSGYKEEHHSQDKMLQQMVAELDLTQVRLPDAWIDWLSPPADPDAYAIVHPRVDSIPLIGWRCRIENPDSPTIGYPTERSEQYLKLWKEQGKIDTQPAPVNDGR